MTEAPLPPDELVSRYLDGDLPDELRAIVEGDPRLQADVAQMRSLREALRNVDPIDPARASAALTAALAAYDTAFGADAAPSSPVVVSLRAARWRRTLVWAGGVAAAGLVVVGGAALLDQGDSGSQVADEQVTTLPEQLAAEPSAAAEAFTADAPSTDPSGGADRSVAASEVPLEPTPPEELTSAPLAEPFPLPPPGRPVVLDDATMLEWFARSVEPTPVEDLDPADVACLDAGPDLLLSANATYAGVPATIFYDDVTGEAVAYEAATCEILARVAL